MEFLRTKSFPSVANGLLALAIDTELSKVHADLEDRPDVDKDRTVTIKLKLRPAKGERNEDNGKKVDRGNELEAARVNFQVTHSLPPQSFSRKMLNVSGKSAFGFESDTNAIKFDPRQMRFPADVDVDVDLESVETEEDTE